MEIKLAAVMLNMTGSLHHSADWIQPLHRVVSARQIHRQRGFDILAKMIFQTLRFVRQGHVHVDHVRLSLSGQYARRKFR